jgi:hypothetical protein
VVVLVVIVVVVVEVMVMLMVMVVVVVVMVVMVMIVVMGRGKLCAPELVLAIRSILAWKRLPITHPHPNFNLLSMIRKVDLMAQLLK